MKNFILYVLMISWKNKKKIFFILSVITVITIYFADKYISRIKEENLVARSEAFFRENVGIHISKSELPAIFEDTDQGRLNAKIFGHISLEITHINANTCWHGLINTGDRIFTVGPGNGPVEEYFISYNYFIKSAARYAKNGILRLSLYKKTNNWLPYTIECEIY